MKKRGCYIKQVQRIYIKICNVTDRRDMEWYDLEMPSPWVFFFHPFSLSCVERREAAATVGRSVGLYSPTYLLLLFIHCWKRRKKEREGEHVTLKEVREALGCVWRHNNKYVGGRNFTYFPGHVQYFRHSFSHTHTHTTMSVQKST